MSVEKREITEIARNSIKAIRAKLETLKDPTEKQIKKEIESVFDSIFTEDDKDRKLYLELTKIYHPDRLPQEAELYSLLLSLQAIGVPEKVLLRKNPSHKNHDTLPEKKRTPPIWFVLKETINNSNFHLLIEKINESLGWYQYKQQKREKLLFQIALAHFIIVALPWTLVHRISSLLLSFLNDKNDEFLDLCSQKKYQELSFNQSKIQYLHQQRLILKEDGDDIPDMTDEEFYHFLVTYLETRTNKTKEKIEEDLILEIKDTPLSVLKRVSLIFESTRSSITQHAKEITMLSSLKIAGIIFGSVFALTLNVAFHSALQGLTYFLQVGRVLATLLTSVCILTASGILEGRDLLKYRNHKEPSSEINPNAQNKNLKQLCYDQNQISLVNISEQGNYIGLFTKERKYNGNNQNTVAQNSLPNLTV